MTVFFNFAKLLGGWGKSTYYSNALLRILCEPVTTITQSALLPMNVVALRSHTPDNRAFPAVDGRMARVDIFDDMAAAEPHWRALESADNLVTPYQNYDFLKFWQRHVGVDIAGPRPGGARYDYTQIREHVELARDAGLGVTIHVGEEGGAYGVDELGEVVEALRPDRIGHGILAARDPDLMATIRGADITLEICPTSNLLTKALADEDAVREVFRTFVEHGVPFTIATDGPEMMRTHLRDEFELLGRIGALDEEELRTANERGHEASFLGRRAHAQA